MVEHADLADKIVADTDMPAVAAEDAARHLWAAAQLFAEHAPHDHADGTSTNRFLWAAETAAFRTGQAVQHGR